MHPDVATLLVVTEPASFADVTRRGLASDAPLLDTAAGASNSDARSLSTQTICISWVDTTLQASAGRALDIGTVNHVVFRTEFI